MKCNKCGFENKESSKFCTKCGSALNVAVPVNSATAKNSNTKYIIIALIAIIIILVGCIGFFALNSNSGDVGNDEASQSVNASQASESEPVETEVVSSSSQSSTPSHTSSSSQVSDSKSWQSIGRYSGSGSGSQTISVPPGKIMVKLSAYPIKNYATNHLYVSGSNGESGGVDWGSKSKVETRSDSFTYTSNSEETFTIDYYETVSWEVEFFIYE